LGDFFANTSGHQSAKRRHDESSTLRNSTKPSTLYYGRYGTMSAGSANGVHLFFTATGRVASKHRRIYDFLYIRVVFFVYLSVTRLSYLAGGREEKGLN
jgi:hypothetical protein